MSKSMSMASGFVFVPTQNQNKTTVACDVDLQASFSFLVLLSVREIAFAVFGAPFFMFQHVFHQVIHIRQDWSLNDANDQ